MPTIVGILTFISMVNTTSESLKAINVIIFQKCIYYEQLKFELSTKKYYILWLEHRVLSQGHLNILNIRGLPLLRKYGSQYVSFAHETALILSSPQ